MPRRIVSLRKLKEKPVRQSENLKRTYRRFMKEKEPTRREEAGEALIRAIFGTDAIAEDTLR